MKLPPPSLVTSIQLSVSLNLLASAIIEYLSFCVWLTSLSMMKMVHPCYSICQNSVPFHDRIILHRMPRTHSVCPVTHWWPLGWFPLSGFWAQSCCEHRCRPHHSFSHPPGTPCLGDFARPVPSAWTAFPQGIHIAHSSVPPSPLLNLMTGPSPSPLSFSQSTHHFSTHRIMYLLSIRVVYSLCLSSSRRARIRVSLVYLGQYTHTQFIEWT